MIGICKWKSWWLFYAAVRRMKKPGDRVDEEVQWALILPDFCFVHLPHGRLSGAHSTISIEIKVSSSKFINITNIKVLCLLFLIDKQHTHTHTHSPKTTDVCTYTNTCTHHTGMHTDTDRRAGVEGKWNWWTSNLEEKHAPNISWCPK